MKKLIIGALGLSLLASSAAFAQEAATPPPPPPPAETDAPPPPVAPGPEARGPEAGDKASPRGDDRRGPSKRGPKDEARGGPKGHDGPPPPPPSKAAEFRFKRGPLEVAVRCSELEPIKPCADAANQLMDKFAALPEPGLMPGDRSTASDPLPGGETAPGSGGPAPAPKP